MENGTIQHTTIGNISPHRNGERIKGNGRSAHLRLSDIKVHDRVVPMSVESDLVLLDLVKRHIGNLGEIGEVRPGTVSDILVGLLADNFGFMKGQLAVMDDMAVIYEPLRYDYYLFDFKPFMKLKYLSPKLYVGMATLLVNLGFPFVEDQGTRYWQDFYFEILAETQETKRLEKEMERYDNAINDVEEIKATADDNPAKVMKMLRAYKPKNGLFKDIKDFLLRFLEVRFTFKEDYPHAYYVDPDSWDTDRNYYGDCIEVYERIALYCYNSAFFNETLQETLQGGANHCQLFQPVSIIDKKGTGWEKRKNISDFEVFADGFAELTERLYELNRKVKNND